ncbi:related to PRP43-spliceosomal RNA helicase (DEAH-box family) [Sporisorium reilianum SRZ2]|uniref:RNA helicase n=1 Tax=Sporisorium reilianum (strain SRZ2) TaxID=999809 RepID=E6ZZD7_SPORE|nr:related to PRP43-spliceosomal RNA helicase (DEAH-box family) [Sporisorium reilianum SRZ2]
MSTSTVPPAFWKPGTARPGSALDRSSTTTPLITSASTPSATLPIHAQRLAILHALETHQTLILVGATGSGKTTQLPQLLLAAGWASASTGIIACTQPRRIAATAAAARVSAELGTPLGQEVGYSIRFEEHSSAATRVRYMTDGALFRECVRDPLLTRYSVVVVDEAHERGVWTDLLLGVLRKIGRKRREFRVVVASATMDAVAMRDFFGDGAAVLTLDGARRFPVHTAFLAEPCADFVQQTIDTIWAIHLTEPQGDILAFLTGRDEIDAVLQHLADRQTDLPASAARMHLLPLHAGLSAAEQTAIFAPTPAAARKVVVATNIAEASITLDGVVYVVDCGFVKVRTATANGIDALSVVPISRASAVQRTGRAGRTRAGKCFRLYTEAAFGEMRATTPPALHRAGVVAALLMLKALGVDDVVRFAWVPPAPAAEVVAAGLQTLVRLGALDAHARLTQMGGWMGEMPLPPHWARIVLAAAEARFACAQEVLTIAAMLQVTHPFIEPDSAQTQLSVRRFAAQQGDMYTLLNVYLAFTAHASAKWCTRHRLSFAALSRAVSIRAQLERFLHRFAASAPHLDSHSSCLGRDDAVERITKCLLTGLFPNLARWDDATMSYTTVLSGTVVHAHPTSVFFNRRPDGGKVWVVYGEAVSADAGGKVWIRDLCVLDELEWVTESVPGVYRVETRWGGGERRAVRTSGGAEDEL